MQNTYHNNDSGGESFHDIRVDPVDLERQEPNGRIAPRGTEPDGSVPPDRAPNGEFVSPDREPVDSFGRRRSDGRFDDLRAANSGPKMEAIKATAEETMQARNDVLVQSRGRGGNEAMQESAVVGQAQAADVSLTPEEAIDGAMAGSIETTRTDPRAGMNEGLADIPEAMDAFANAEEQRGGDQLGGKDLFETTLDAAGLGTTGGDR